MARGDARPDSDIDLLVTWREGTTLLDHAALKLELEGLLGRKVDIASDGWVKPSVRESVYRDAVPLFRSDSDRLHQVWMMARKELPMLEDQVQQIRARIAGDSGPDA